MPQLYEYRIKKLEDQTDRIEQKLTKIMENHLPHIRTELQALKTRMGAFTALNVSAVIIGLLLAKFL
jgi:hypothetical protein